jgi:hypothetical protein
LYRLTGHWHIQGGQFLFPREYKVLATASGQLVDTATELDWERYQVTLVNTVSLKTTAVRNIVTTEFINHGVPTQCLLFKVTGKSMNNSLRQKTSYYRSPDFEAGSICCLNMNQSFLASAIKLIKNSITTVVLIHVI